MTNYLGRIEMSEISSLLLSLPLPLPPWSLVRLGDDSVSGHPRWVALLHGPTEWPGEWLLSAKWGTGPTAGEALRAALSAASYGVLRTKREALSPGVSASALACDAKRSEVDSSELGF